MNKILIFLYLFLSLKASAYYVDYSRTLRYDNGQYAGISGVVDFDLNFRTSNYGFILLNTGNLLLATNNNGWLKVYNKAVAYNVSQISYPYYINGEDLYLFDHNNFRYYRIASRVTDLCRSTVRELHVNANLSKYYYISGNQLIEINSEDRPSECY